MIAFLDNSSLFQWFQLFKPIRASKVIQGQIRLHIHLILFQSPKALNSTKADHKLQTHIHFDQGASIFLKKSLTSVSLDTLNKCDITIFHSKLFDNNHIVLCAMHLSCCLSGIAPRRRIALQEDLNEIVFLDFVWFVGHL